MEQLFTLLSEWPTAAVLLYFAHGTLSIIKSEFKTLQEQVNRIAANTEACPARDTRAPN